MALDIIGKDVKLWVDHHDGKWNSYGISFSKKTDSGYKNKNIKVFFSNKVLLPDEIHNGDNISFKGFPTVDVWTNKDGKEILDPAIMIMECEFQGGFKSAEDDIPF